MSQTGFLLTWYKYGGGGVGCVCVCGGGGGGGVWVYGCVGGWVGVCVRTWKISFQRLITVIWTEFLCYH